MKRRRVRRPSTTGTSSTSHIASEAPLTVATYERTHQVDFGVLDIKDGHITSFTEKPNAYVPGEPWVSTQCQELLARLCRKGLPYGFDEVICDLIGAVGCCPPVYPFNGYWARHRATRRLRPCERGVSKCSFPDYFPECDDLLYRFSGKADFLGSHVHEAINRSEKHPRWVAGEAATLRSCHAPNSSWVPWISSRLPWRSSWFSLGEQALDAVSTARGEPRARRSSCGDLNTTFVDKLIPGPASDGPARSCTWARRRNMSPNPRNPNQRDGRTRGPVSIRSFPSSPQRATIASAAEKGDISAHVLRVFNPIGRECQSTRWPERPCTS